MNISEQVCTLEQAKRLKEFGVKQESLFYVRPYGAVCRRISVIMPTSCYAAFTIAELSAMIPTHVTFEDDQYFFQIIRGSKRWLAEWHTNKKELAILSDGELDRPRGVLWNTYKGNKYLVNVLADWVIAILEENLISVTDVNSRL